MIRNVILDWSGTLVDDLPAVWQATNHVLGRAGLPPMTLEVFRREFRLPFTGFYDRLTPHISMDQLELWFHSHFEQTRDSVTELPHARDFLQFCRDRRLRTFLLSTLRLDHYQSQASRTGLDAFLDRPYLGVWDKRAKIRGLLEENDLAAGETLFVGDMEHDIETARHGGVHACAVLTGYNRREQLESSCPDLIVEHLGQLREILDRNNLQFPGPSPSVAITEP